MLNVGVTDAMRNSVVLPLVLFQTPSRVSCFRCVADRHLRMFLSPRISLSGFAVCKRPRHSLFVVSSSPNNQDSTEDENNDYDDDEEECLPSYGNRSLAWTSRYRSLLPYEKARASVMQLGLRSKGDWDEYVAEGKSIMDRICRIIRMKCMRSTGYLGKNSWA